MFASPTGTRKLRCSDRARHTFNGCLGQAHPFVENSVLPLRPRRRLRRRLHLFYLRQTPQAVPAFRSRGCSKSSPQPARDAARNPSASSSASRPTERFRSPVVPGFVRAASGSSGRRLALSLLAASWRPISAASASVSSRLPLAARRASSSSRRVGTTWQNFSGPEARLRSARRAAPVGRSRSAGGGAVKRALPICGNTRSSSRSGLAARISFTLTSL